MKKRLTVVVEKTNMTPDDAHIGPPLPWSDSDLKIDVSCVFTWHKEAAQKLAEIWKDWGCEVKIGGPAFDDYGGEFIPGRFIKKGVVITHRGCIRNCPWCYVPAREGKIRELEVHEGNVLQDSNILACSREHQRKVFSMLRQQKRVRLLGGIDVRLLTDWAIEEIRSLRLEDMWIAYDSQDLRPTVLKAIKRLNRAGIPPRKLRCYMMLGFGENPSQAEERCQEAYLTGCFPFAQLYDRYSGEDIKEFKKVVRTWSRPAGYVTKMKAIKTLIEDL